MQILHLDIPDNLDFVKAQSLAKQESRKFLSNPMILSWLDRRRECHSPPDDCCGHEGKETWEIYAESRGGSLKVEIGNDYVFILREGLA